MSEDFKVGDIISMKGPTVPSDLLDCYWRVKTVNGGDNLALDGPYRDSKATVRYHPSRRSYD